jgi:hypothetical protein
VSAAAPQKKSTYELLHDRKVEVEVLLIRQRRAISDAEIDIRAKKVGIEKAKGAMEARIRFFNEKKGEQLVDLKEWKTARELAHQGRSNLDALRKMVQAAVIEAKKAGEVVLNLEGEHEQLERMLRRQGKILVLPIKKKIKKTRKTKAKAS